MSKSGRPRAFKDTAVVDAAVEVFWSRGYEACSTDDLCKETGLGRGSLYNAFGSKHELYEQALIRYQQLGLSEQIDILRADMPVKERLRSLLEWEIREDSAAGDRGCLLINASAERGKSDPSVEKIFTQHASQLERAIEEAMREGQSNGEISPERNAQELAAFFLSSYYGLRVLYPGTMNRALAGRIIDGVLAAVF
ncbi:TetR/AcrR family transcriptional regulator [Cohnella thailandensis]|uniref:TetR/AcrR family transcriptional regulator n=1 Tax=Cohnella thailandensis TaxID=557557 RepID=A0A841SL74_9BACL|nr:TetR/AcrR family transcriptional regulator [Cohnella thailandensis]MBB6633253.1 TetR/AcrR family transcriptional regulator [Cohnella thailandensis]MBP1975049.1 AcrR family transcriptional regulator [Cohnella thailandensis]